jgi:hypothetical protein
MPAAKWNGSGADGGDAGNQSSRPYIRRSPRSQITEGCFVAPPTPTSFVKENRLGRRESGRGLSPSVLGRGFGCSPVPDFLCV